MPEYALMAGLILVIAAAAVGLVGGEVNLLFLSYPN
jgi:Flp pilus assembly pilin Flp